MQASLLSPLRGDWSTRRLPDSRMPSAGIRSPAWSSTRSPTTTSETGRSRTPSARLTRQTAASASCCKRAKARSLPHSDTVETKVDRNTATAMPTGSAQEPSPRETSRFSPRATNKIRMMGSEKLSKNRVKNVLRLCRVKALEPYRRRAASTWARLSPGRELISIDSTSPKGVCNSLCTQLDRYAVGIAPGLCI